MTENTNNENFKDEEINEASNLNEVQQNESNLKQHINPFLIFKKPDEVLKKALAKGQDELIIIIAFAGGMFNILEKAQEHHLADAKSGEQFITYLIFSILIAGPVSGIMYLYLGSWFLRLGVKIFKGTATAEDIRVVIAYASLPVLVGSFIFWAISLPLFGVELFKSYQPYIKGNLVYIMLILIDIISALWACVFSIKGIKIANNFTTLKAVGVIFIPALILATVIILVALGELVVVGH